MRSWAMEKRNISQISLTEELSKDFVRFNEQIGLPIHPKTGIPSPLTYYQLEIFDTMCDNDLILLLKAKKLGFTEIFLRAGLYRCIHTWNDAEFMLIPASREMHSRSLLQRMNSLCNAPILRPYIKKRNERMILFDNGVVVRQYPSNYQAIIGRPRVCGLYLDEAAFTDSTDDTPLYGAAVSNLANTAGSAWICSTANGARGFFWTMCDKPPRGWKFLKYDYTHGLKAGLLDEQFVENARIDDTLNFPQNYECRFDAGGYSALGDINTVKEEEIDFNEPV